MNFCNGGFCCIPHSSIESFSLSLVDLSNKLEQLASRDFIEEKLKEVVTESILQEAIKRLKDELMEHVKSQLSHVCKMLHTVQQRCVVLEKDVESLKSSVSDSERNLEESIKQGVMILKSTRLRWYSTSGVNDQKY